MAGRVDAAPINRKPYVPMSRQVKGLAVLPSANNCQGSLEKAQPVGMASRIRPNSDAKPTAHTELVALAWAGSLADQARSYPVQSMVQTLVSLTDTEGGAGPNDLIGERFFAASHESEIGTELTSVHVCFESVIGI
jgi:hypothetical protein